MPIEFSSGVPPEAAALQLRQDPALTGRVVAISGQRSDRPAVASDVPKRQADPPRRDDEAVSEAAEKINRRLAPSGASIEFAVDEKTQRMVARIVDTETHEVIRQIPSETSLMVAAALDKLMPGVLLQEEA